MKKWSHVTSVWLLGCWSQRFHLCVLFHLSLCEVLSYLSRWVMWSVWNLSYGFHEESFITFKYHVLNFKYIILSVKVLPQLSCHIFAIFFVNVWQNPLSMNSTSMTGNISLLPEDWFHMHVCRTYVHHFVQNVTFFACYLKKKK